MSSLLITRNDFHVTDDDQHVMATGDNRIIHRSTEDIRISVGITNALWCVYISEIRYIDK